MSSQLNNHQGMTFIEVLVTAAISIIGASLLFFFVQKVRMHKSGVDGSLIIKESMADNIVEIKGALMADLPASGKCLIRVYRNDKSYLTESLLDKPCSTPSVQRGQFKIGWDIASTASIVPDANFNNEFMELPTTSDPLRKITVNAWYYRDSSSLTIDHNQIVIFKR